MSDFAAALMKLWPAGDHVVPGLRAGIIKAAPEVFTTYGLTSPLLVAHAMAQFSHECGAGAEMVENIHYTAARAIQVWPTRFSTVADCYAKVGSFPGDPLFATKLIDNVYGGRMGNVAGTHDGSTFIGRGLSQVTGRENYLKLGDLVGLDLLAKPALIISPDHAIECGVADFVMCGCLPFAQADDLVRVTKRLNGGTIGLTQRADWLKKWKAELTSITLQPATVGPPAKPVVVNKPPIPAAKPPNAISRFFTAIMALFGRK